MWRWLLILASAALVVTAEGAGAGAARLVCYVENARETNSLSECTHLVYTGDARGAKLDALLKEYRKDNPRLKILVRVTESDSDVRSLQLSSKFIQGLEIYDAHRTLNKTKVLETVRNIRETLHSIGGGPLFLALPGHAELLAKYYDLRTLLQNVDLMTVQTHALGVVKKMTYHPSRLSGLWDMMNTDSVVDLVVGLGVPASKIVVSLPATAYRFTLVNETLSTPGSPAVNDDPTELDQAELCSILKKGRWTLERDQDLSAPYAFQNKTWVAFEDASSIDVKGKYARVRGLAGLALHKADKDPATSCGPTVKTLLAKVLNQQSRAPRAAVLRSLENEILSAHKVRGVDALQVSPYRITQVVDSDGIIHSIREDTRTEFSCIRQGYFVHPRSCARFYRCVKFDQLSPDYTVFEFDCPDGLAFDARFEVCVWPGSVPHSQACPGSSEIAPVPQSRFICPDKEGFFVDPENCRWFFACLDHGKSPLSAYEFRCPFGLGFDPEKLKCEWPWLVPACGNIGKYEATAFGFTGAALTGAVGFQGQTAQAVNVAAHNNLASGASLDNLVGVQGGYLSNNNDFNTYTNQDFVTRGDIENNGESVASGLQTNQYSPHQNTFTYHIKNTGQSNIGENLRQLNKFQDDKFEKYKSGSLILDEYRSPSNAATSSKYAYIQNVLGANGLAGFDQTALYQSTENNVGKERYYTSSLIPNSKAKLLNSQQLTQSEADLSGAYIHDPTGDTAEPYVHVDQQSLPYRHHDVRYKNSGGYFNNEKYTTSNDNSGRYSSDNSGLYIQDDSSYIGNTNPEYTRYSNAYASGNFNEGKYVASSSTSNAYSGKYNHLNSISASDFTTYGQGYDSSVGYKYLKPVPTLIPTTQHTAPVSTKSQNNFQILEYGTALDSGHTLSKFGNYEGSVTNIDAYTNSGQGVTVGLLNKSNLINGVKSQNYQGSYEDVNKAKYITDSKLYAGGGHTLTAGAVNAGLVGKTTLLVTGHQSSDYESASQASAGYSTASQSFESVTQGHPFYLSEIPQSVVAISHVGTDNKDYKSHNYVTSPTASLVPTTITPFTVTTSTPNVSTFKTTYVTEVPNTKVNKIFSLSEPAVTAAHPTIVSLKQQFISPKVETYGYNQHANVEYDNKAYSSLNTDGSSQASGYDYPKPNTKFEDGISYTTVAPSVVISKLKPQGFSHGQQTLHNVESVGYDYPSPVTEEPFKKLVAYTTGPSVTTYAPPEVSTILPQIYSHQTIHQVKSNDNSQLINSDVGYNYDKPVSYGQPQILETLQTETPPSFSYKPSSVVSNVFTPTTPLEHSRQSNIIISQPNASVQYKTSQPAYSSSYQKIQNVKPFHYSSSASTTGFTDIVKSGISQELPKSTINYSLDGPAYSQTVESASQPQIYNQEIVHKVDNSNIKAFSQDTLSFGNNYSPPSSNIDVSSDYELAVTPSISTYNPKTFNEQIIIKGEPNKIVGISSTPQRQSSFEVRHPTVTINENPFKKFTSPTTPANIQPIAVTYKPPAQPLNIYEISQSHHNNNNIAGYNLNILPEIQRNTELISGDSKIYSDAVGFSHQVIHHSNYKNQHESENSDFVLPLPTKTSVLEQHYSPNVQYGGREYLPSKSNSLAAEPKSSTQSSYFIHQQNAEVYQSKDENDYNSGQFLQQYSTIRPILPIKNIISSTTTVQPKIFGSIHKSSFPGTKVVTKYKQVNPQLSENQASYETKEYLPPTVTTETPLVTTYKPSADYSFSTTTGEYLPPSTETTYNVPTTVSSPNIIGYLQPSTYVPLIKSSDLEFHGPEYLPPNESEAINFESFESKNFDKTSDAQYKQYLVPNDSSNVVPTNLTPIIQNEGSGITSKTNLLGFGTVGPDAGLVESVKYTSTLAPTVLVSSTRIPPRRKPTSSLPPIQQDFVEITSPIAPITRIKPKVAVVTKINDFNPLLVKKLGAVCSCQSANLVLKGQRPDSSYSSVYLEKDLHDYSNRDDDAGNNYRFSSTSPRSRLVKTKQVTTTFNPIIVPDDTYYEDYPDTSNINVAIAPEAESDDVDTIISSTKAPYYSSTPKSRQRIKTVTVAPNYRQILLNEQNIQSYPKNSALPAPTSQAFDRYGPGGLRSQDETLQGSVDCQRPGLFRHPKQCNKFYACRWDCTKQRYTLHIFNCPVQLTFDPSLGACNWPSQGPACQGDTLLTNTL